MCSVFILISSEKLEILFLPRCFVNFLLIRQFHHFSLGVDLGGMADKKNHARTDHFSLLAPIYISSSDALAHVANFQLFSKNFFSYIQLRLLYLGLSQARSISNCRHCVSHCFLVLLDKFAVLYFGC